MADTPNVNTKTLANEASSIASKAASVESQPTPKEPVASVSEEVDVLEEPTKEDVVKAIKESDSLITAVESVAAMYAIPSTHIIQDDSQNSIKVVRDNILVPSTDSKPTDNAKAIVQSIGAVLDYISQRVDNKINKFQNNNIAKAEAIESIKNNSDPSKGRVISRHVDANGDEVLVYDSGLVDLANTKEAHAKVDELRAAGEIPDHKYDPDEYNKKVDTDYFSDEDVTAGVDMSAGSNTVNDTSLGTNLNMDTSVSTPTETDIGNAVGESYTFINAIAARGDTCHLGYELLQEAGFDFVKPVNMILESDDNKKKAYDVQHMKFDNKNLLQAIKYFNEARAEQKDVPNGELNIEQFMNNKNYQKGVDCLNKQFNIHLNIRFFSTKDKISNASTPLYNDIKPKLTISKSKGFQLGGLAIDVFVINDMLTDEAPKDISLFGQHFASTLCHEFFHNIMCVLTNSRAEFTASLTTTLEIAQTLPTAKSRRAIISNFVKSIDDFNGIKLNAISRRAIIKHLTVMSTIAHDEAALNAYAKTVATSPSEIDTIIAKFESRVTKMRKKAYNGGNGALIFAGLIVVGGLIGSLATMNPSVGMACTAVALSLAVPTALIKDARKQALEEVKRGSIKDLEEHWCDMFASMYNVPTTFFLGFGKMFNPVDATTQQIKKWNDLEREFMQLSFGTYPTLMERNHAAVKCAKKALESDVKLDPSIKKYLEWVVETFSGSLDINIDDEYTKSTFDPKTAEDLDRHIDALINRANIHVTESDLSWLNSFDINNDYLD